MAGERGAPGGGGFDSPAPGPSRTQLARRRALALAAAVGATVLLYLLLFGDEGGERDRELPPETSGETRGLLADLPAEDKAAQLLLAGVDAEEVGAAPQVGGWLVDERSWEGPEQGRELLAALERRSGALAIPPLLATRQEGGDHRALAGIQPRLRAIEIGDIGTRRAARAWSRLANGALAELGFDLNLAPVADIATLDSPLSDRAFSDDPELVAAQVAQAIAACRRAGIVCAPAHFPGLGAASQDTDQGPATVSLDRATVLSRELLPFEAAFEVGVEAVVVSNAFYAAFDPVTPASLSPEVMEELLRGRLGFRGVAITDDLAAGAIRAQTTDPEVAVQAVNAGADLVQVADPALAQRALGRLRGAAANGEIPGDRLNQAAARVLELKRRAGLSVPG